MTQTKLTMESLEYYISLIEGIKGDVRTYVIKNKRGRL